MNAVPLQLHEFPTHVPIASESVELRIVDPTADDTWEALLWTHPRATFFHSQPWARALTQAYGFTCRYIVATSRGELRGLLPIMEASSWLRPARGVSLPFTDECAPLVSSGVTAESLLNVAQHEGSARRWRYLEIRGSHEASAPHPEAVAFHGHVLNLDGKADQIFERFDSSVQRNIRKAEREGVTVEFASDHGAVRDYYQLHCRTRTRLGAPPQPFNFFEALCENILAKGHGFIALAKHQGRIIAGAVFLRYARTAIYKFSASDERCLELRGPNAVLWQSIRRLIDAGVMQLDFGKTSCANEGLRRFKRQWGAQERAIRYFRYDFAKRRFVKITDMAAGIQARLFALMPVAVSRTLGRALYPHLT